MSRRRWLPASGARVAPVRRMPARRRMMSSSMEPTRRDGRDTEICSASQRSIVPRREVTRAEGKEGYVVEPGVVQAVFEDFFQIRQAAFAGGAVQDARLTETATPGTPAGDFEAEAVVDRTERDHLLFGIGGPVKISHDTASGRRQIRFQRREHAVGVMRVQRRRIDAGNVDGFLDKARTAPAFFAGLDHEVAQFRDHLLAFAEEHEVHERGERFRGNGASAARDDEGPAEQIVPAIGGAERDAGKFQHVQYVGEAQFMCDREREHVRLHDVRVAFQRGEADAVFADSIVGLFCKSETNFLCISFTIST